VSAGTAGGAFRVAITIDAEHPDRVHRSGCDVGLIDLLAERGVRATWFLQGRWVEANPATARRIADDGHLIANHSHYHARMPLLTDAGLAADVRDAESAIVEATGADPRPWFRCPFGAGATDPRVLGGLAGLGYRDVPADVVLDDWEPERTGPLIAADGVRLATAHGDGAVVLLHSWPSATLEALPVLLSELAARGARFVTIDELERFSAEPR
jgi:peptidoglycan/xylan/chitin deacetylase (PgdA/CDA1 family)